MNTNRRQFLGNGFLLAAMGLGMTGNDLLHEMALAADAEGEPFDINQETLDFWTKQVREPVRRTIVTRNGIRSTRNMDDKSMRVPEFFVYGPDGFIPAQQVEERKMLDVGDVSIATALRAFKTSQADRTEANRITGGNFRIDLQQGVQFPVLNEKLSWASMVGIFPEKDRRLPDFEELKFDPGSTWERSDPVPLPNGLGYWTWNFFVQQQKQQGFFSSLFKGAGKVLGLLKSTGAVLAGFGLPAISVHALGRVDHMYGALNAINGHPKWIYQSPDMAIAATRQALDEAKVPRDAVLPLVEGETNYVVVPRLHVAAFGKAMPDLKLVRGLVVPKETKETDVYVAAPQVLPDITYMSINMKVKKLSHSLDLQPGVRR